MSKQLEQVNKINVVPKDYAIMSLHLQYKEETLILNPTFQREIVYNTEAKSRIIESIILGIPLPPIYLCMSVDSKLITIDGRQRLTSIFQYIDGEYALSSLKILTDLNGKKFKDLDNHIKHTIKNSSLYVLTCTQPEYAEKLFICLNKSKKELNSQELRNGAWYGPFIQMLNRLADIPIVKRILSDTNSNLENQEVFTRFLIFKYTYQTQQFKSQNIAQYLNRYMPYYANLNEKSLQKLEDDILSLLGFIGTYFDVNIFNANKKFGIPHNVGVLVALDSFTQDTLKLHAAEIERQFLGNPYKKAKTGGVNANVQRDFIQHYVTLISNITGQSPLTFDLQSETIVDTPMTSLNSDVLRSTDIKIKHLGYEYKANELICNPGYQRKYKYNRQEASEIIHSILLGIPLPNFYFCADKHLTTVVDGQQRLTSIFNYIYNINTYGKNKDFRLKLDASADLYDLINNKRFEDLEPELKDIILDYTLHIIQIPSELAHAKYEIFKRLNTKNTVLTPYELHRAIFYGPYLVMINELVNLPQVCHILTKAGDINAKAEHILRFFYLRDFQAYNTDYSTTRKKFLEQHWQDDINKINTDKQLFLDTLDTVYKVLGTDFAKTNNRVSPLCVSLILVCFSYFPADVLIKYAAEIKARLLPRIATMPTRQTPYIILGNLFQSYRLLESITRTKGTYEKIDQVQTKQTVSDKVRQLSLL